MPGLRPICLRGWGPRPIGLRGWGLRPIWTRGWGLRPIWLRGWFGLQLHYLLKSHSIIRSRGLTSLLFRN